MKTRIGVFAKILCISPNGLQASHCDAPPPPFWMTENHFRSHFSPFQINMQRFFFFSQNGWMTKNHFWMYFSPFQINTQLFFWIFFQNGRRWPFWKADLGHFGWPKITFDSISRHFRSIRNFLFFLEKKKSKWPLYLTTNTNLEIRFAPKAIGFLHYVLSMAMPNMKLIGKFIQLEMPQAFGAFLYKMTVKEHFVFFRLMPKIIRFL